MLNDEHLKTLKMGFVDLIKHILYLEEEEVETENEDDKEVDDDDNQHVVTK